MCDIKKTVIVILVVVQVGREIAMVDPDVGGSLNSDGIAIFSQNFLYGQVAYDNVLLFVYVLRNIF